MEIFVTETFKNSPIWSHWFLPTYLPTRADSNVKSNNILLYFYRRRVYLLKTSFYSINLGKDADEKIPQFKKYFIVDDTNLVIV